MTLRISIKKGYNSGTYKLWKVKLGENYPEPSATRNAMFKVIRSNTEIAITPQRIVRLRSNLVQSLITYVTHAIHCRCSRSKVKGQGHSVMYQQQKRYNTAMDRFSDFKLGMVS